MSPASDGSQTDAKTGSPTTAGLSKLPLVSLQLPVEPAVRPCCAKVVTLPCIHCREPVTCPSQTNPSDVFCCTGCRSAHQMIGSWGLQDFYALRDQSRLQGAAQAAGQSSRFEHFDSAEFLGTSAPRKNADGSYSAELAVQGLHCGACAWLIENAAAREPGLLSARVKMSKHTIQLIFDPKKTQLSRIAQFLDGLGYRLAPLEGCSDGHIDRESRRQLIQIAVAGFLAANAMWIAIALYAGEASGVTPDIRYFLVLVGTLLGVAAVCIPGRTFFTGAFASLRTRTPHMDLPVALGLGVGSIVGTINAIRGQGDVYFDCLATLVFLLLIGRWIQFRQQQRAARAVDLMIRITPRYAELERSDGSTASVLVDSLVPGDVVRVMAGDCVPADGEVLRGESKLDRSLLTGESNPVTVKVGDELSAGTINLVSPLSVSVSATGRDTRIGKVMDSVEAAATEKTPIVMLADRIGGYFVIVVTLLAVVAFVMWLPSGVSTATSHSTALLIVACPCALALATPLAIAVGLGRAAKRNILIRDGESLQQLSKPGRIWLDKTGTLTEGRQRVTSLTGDIEALRFAAAVEAECKHPIAAAIQLEARNRNLMPVENCDVVRAVRGGLTGAAGGRQVAVGNLELMRDLDAEFNSESQLAMHHCVEQGESPVLIAIDGHVAAVLGVSDPIRSGAQDAIAQMKGRGWKVGILSGDLDAIVHRVGEQLGVESTECFGGLSPEEKLNKIRDSRSAGDTVTMVGDGANDAAALAAADVGIAVRGGAEVSLQAAPVYIASGKLQSLVQLMRGASRTTQLIWLTFAVSLLYNVVAVGLAICGWISPLLAAILMPISSASVLAITLASKTFPESSP